MKFVIQRVQSASVTINQKVHSQIKLGYLIYMGIHKDDSKQDCEKWIDKILKLRLFADEKKPINASHQDVKGEILLVSQFTLYGDAKGQNRPSFMDAAAPGLAREIYDYFTSLLKSKWPPTQTGEFAADMQVSSINDGPVTLILE